MSFPNVYKKIKQGKDGVTSNLLVGIFSLSLFYDVASLYTPLHFIEMGLLFGAPLKCYVFATFAG